MKLPHDLFRHTMRFQNPQTKTAEMILNVIKTLHEVEETWHNYYPYRSERKGFQATEECCTSFSTWAAESLSVNKHKPEIFYRWAINQYLPSDWYTNHRYI